MKQILFITLTTLFLSVSGTQQAKACALEEPAVVDTLKTIMPKIENIKKTMLEMGDSCNFYFSGDTELEEYDPHAFWLMNRMMQMVQMIQTADDGWAWMLAMDECIVEYNSRLGRKLGSAEAAMMAIDGLISIYNAGNQPQLNTATYVNMITAHYRAMHEYSMVMEAIKDYNDDNDDDIRLMNLYYREYCAWFDINNAINGLMYFYSFGMARYSSLPMDLNGAFEIWSDERRKELKIEGDICDSYSWKPFKSDSKKTSERKFNRLIEYFKERDVENVTRELIEEWYEDDHEYAREKVCENIDFDKVNEMILYYETAMKEWRKAREEITLKLPKERRKSYKDATKQTHTRLYNDLKELKKLWM